MLQSSTPSRIHYPDSQATIADDRGNMSATAGSSKKATVYVGGFANEVNEQQLLDAFVTFGTSRVPSKLTSFFPCIDGPGDIIDITLPTEPNEREPAQFANRKRFDIQPKNIKVTLS